MPLPVPFRDMRGSNSPHPCTAPVCPLKGTAMPSLTLIVLFILILVVTLTLGLVGYLVHRHPTLAAPVGVMAAVAGVFAAFIIPIAIR